MLGRENFTTSVNCDIAHLLVRCGAANSKGQARRLIEQNAVRVNGLRAGREMFISNGDILRVGRRFWRKLRTPEFEQWEDKDNDYIKYLG